jgi:cytochrome c oxidase assembly protein subunit 15
MKLLYKIGLIVLINIYLVIIAGSVVRMTGSGMGCPDWPKCFGYLIPPTDEAKLLWNEYRAFEKGQIIINETKEGKELLVAKKNFVSNHVFNLYNWKKYERHNYAIFNVFHTWTEYINRLMGALLGFFALIMLVLSLKQWEKHKWLAYLSFLQLFFIGFMAWLGKVTVDSNLAPVTITYHMLGVLVLIFIQVYFLIRLKRRIHNEDNLSFKLTSKRIFVVSAIVLLIIQIIMGTQVRQQVDELLDADVSRGLIANNFDLMFYIHRSFSIIILLNIVFIFYKNWLVAGLRKTIFYLSITVLAEIFIGMFLVYFGMQAIGQPIHLFLSILMFGFLAKIYFNLKIDK